MTKSIKKLLEANTASGRRRMSDVFKDFCEVSALTLRNGVDLVGKDTGGGWDKREARYLEIAGGYTREELTRFGQSMALVRDALGEGLGDVLGELYMSLDLGNSALGAFYTPFSVSLLSAELAIGDVLAAGSRPEILTIQEPACGSGGMILAAAEVLKRRGVNYQQEVHVTATDIDPSAVHMAYVHCTYAGIPALIVHGNTLSMEVYDVWPTAFHILGGFDYRLRAMRRSQSSTGVGGDEQNAEQDVIEAPASPESVEKVGVLPSP